MPSLVAVSGHEVLSPTTMVDANATLETLRGIKNTIIGNPTQKKELAVDGTLRRVLDWVNASEQTGDPIFESIRAEAAHIIASQAYGPPEALVSVLEAQAPQALLTALKDERTQAASRLTLALTRALRAVITAAAETIGPGRWHFLRDPAHPARMEARLVIEDMFSNEGLEVILPYLWHPEPDVRRNVAILLARGICSDTHRTRIIDYDERSAIWALIGMLGGNVRNQSAATYALAEITRDNETMSRILTDRIPVNVLSQAMGAMASGSIWVRGNNPMASNGLPERSRPSIHIPGSEPSLLSMTRPSRNSESSDQIKDEHIRVLDMICKLLPSRDGDLREAACLCSPYKRFPGFDSFYGNVAQSCPGGIRALPEFGLLEPTASSGSQTEWMKKCRWKSNESEGRNCKEGSWRLLHPRYVVRAFEGGVLTNGSSADFVNDRQDLLAYVVHAGLSTRSPRWSMGSRIKFQSQFWGPRPSCPTSFPNNFNRSPSRPRRISNVSRAPGFFVPPNAPPGYTPVPLELVNAPNEDVPKPRLDSPRPAPPLASPVPPQSLRPPSPGAHFPGGPPSPTQRRRLSFAACEKRRTSSSTGVASVPPVLPEGTPVAGEGAPVTIGGEPDASVSLKQVELITQKHTNDAMAVDTESNQTQGSQRRFCNGFCSTITFSGSVRPYDTVMSNPATSHTTSSAPPAPTPPSVVAKSLLQTQHSDQAPLEQPCWFFFIVVYAFRRMSQDVCRVQRARECCFVWTPHRVSAPPGKPGEIDGVTGVLGAMGSLDAEVRWAGVMLGRAVARSTGVLRTGLYDSGIGRATFEMLMNGEPDKRVLVAVLKMCCNLLNQYSPMREMFIRDGGMQKITELCEAEEQTIRHLSLWAFKNSLFRATHEEKETLMRILGWERLERALDEHPGESLEQALGIVRNISHSESDAEWLITHISPAKLLGAAERTIGGDDSASVASLFALAQVAHIPSVRLLIISRRRILEYIRSSLAHSEVQTRSAAALCVAQMAGCMPRRLREMREVGIDGQLKLLRGREADEEIRDNVLRALVFFESRDG
ncbi:ARM repeat-containing protein [Rhizoctonia solani]|uniref:ARM repeat-containing protein n=1 Tax=Rhizoctonia solani TaxID=456999 RepID=A0A8H7I5J3_9AGAM|nr:ARM repeat-containing protein [Rhizoctonia solani]